MKSDAADDLHRIASAFADPSASRRAAERDLDQLGLDSCSGAKSILDLGCGAGILLDLARQRGMAATGVDSCARAAEEARNRGHQVEHDDAAEALRRLVAAEHRFDGAILSHVIEHLMPAQALELLRAVHAALRPQARLVIRTPNTKNALVLSEFFWLDPTHVRPYPRALLSELGRAAEFRTLHSVDDAASAYSRPRLRQAVQRLRSALSGVDRVGALDAVVVLERSG